MDQNTFSIEPIKRTPLPEIISEKILELIKTQKVKLGDKLPSQNELCKMLNVSRPCIREALLGLIMLGYLEARPGQGYYVRSLKADGRSYALAAPVYDEQAILYIFETRLILEPQAAALAAVRATATDIEELRSLVFQQPDIETKSVATLMEGIDFHQRVAQMSQNTVLIEMINRLFEEFIPRVEMLYSDKLSRDPNFDQHLEIVNSIASGDPKIAYEAVKQHLKNAVIELGIDEYLPNYLL